MPIDFNGKSVERIIFNNKQVNITKVNSDVVLEDNVIQVGTYTGNPTISNLTEEITVNLSYTSNEKNFTQMKLTSSYLYYVGDEEVAVYSFTNNSWAAAYKSISVSTKTFVDTKFYDWFGVNYIKG